MAERLRAPASRVIALQPHARNGRTRWPTDRRGVGGRAAGRGGRRSDVVISMVADDDGGARALRRRRTACSPALRPGRSRRHEHGPARDDPRARAAVRARGAGILDAPVSGSVATGASPGELTIMVGGEAADLERARPVLEPLAQAGLPHRPAGTGAAMKLAVNTLIFGLNGAVAEASCSPSAAGIDRGARLRRPRRAARRAPRSSATSATRFVEPETTPVGLLAGARREGPAPDRELAEARGCTDAPGARSTST